VRINNRISKRIQNGSNGGLISQINSQRGQLVDEDIIKEIKIHLADSHRLMKSFHVRWSSVSWERWRIASESGTKKCNKSVAERGECRRVGEEVNGTWGLGTIEKSNNSGVADFSHDDLTNDGLHEGGLVEAKSSGVFLANGEDFCVNNGRGERVQDGSNGHLVSEVNSKGGEGINENVIEQVEFGFSNSHRLMEGSHVRRSIVSWEARGFASKGSTEESNEASSESLELVHVSKEVNGASGLGSIKEWDDPAVGHFGNDDSTDDGVHELGLVNSQSSRVLLAD